LEDGIARYPVQLLEAGAVTVLALILIWKMKSLRANFRPGIVGFIGIVGYANLRFALEFLRDDFRGFVFGTWLSTSQFISVVLLAGAGCTMPLWFKRSDAPAD
jgi:prolipoprotein diacylglyceryltransferase